MILVYFPVQSIIRFRITIFLISERNDMYQLMIRKKWNED
jgi:hypothetical protein